CVPIVVWVYVPIWAAPERWPTAYHRERYGWLCRELVLACVRTLVLGLIGLVLARRAARENRPATRQRIAAVFPLLVIADLLLSHRWEVPTVSPTYWTKPPA